MKIRELYNEHVLSRGLRNSSESESDWACFGQACYMEFLYEEDKAKKELNKIKSETGVIFNLLSLEKFMKPKNMEKIKNILNPEIVKKYLSPITN